LALSLSDRKADDDAEKSSVTGSGEVESSKVAERRMSDASSEASTDGSIDQWRRSIVVNNVPEDIVGMLIMHLELKKRGGGPVDYHSYHAESRKVLVTFRDATGDCLFVNFTSSQRDATLCWTFHLMCLESLKV